MSGVVGMNDGAADGELYEKSLLVIVIDINPAQKYIRDDPPAIFKTLDSLVAFANAHVLLKKGNEVAFYAAHATDCLLLYPIQPKPGEAEKSMYQRDGQFEGFLALETLIRVNITKIIQDKSFLSAEMLERDESVDMSSCLASSLLKALCYINMKTKQLPLDETLSSRIIVVTGSSESTAQYMAFNNAFFAAQKQGITIDACVLGPYATLLSQGADITGGIYFKPPQGVAGLLQYLMWVFLPDISIRKELTLPPPEPVDYRAACFCHRQLISQGVVCSVCLSIFCKFSPFCTTCNATFKPPASINPLAKTKKRPAATS